MAPTYNTTPVYGLRWMPGTNLVRDIDTGFQALAEDVEDALSTHSFSAYLNSAQALASGGVLICDAEEWDTSSWYSTPTGRYTPQVAGRYRFSWAVRINATPASGKYLESYLRKNG